MSASTTARKPEFVTGPFERSHGRRPRGTGSWAFRAAINFTAFEAECVGEVEFFWGTLTEAKAQAAARFAGAPFVAVLP